MAENRSCFSANLGLGIFLAIGLFSSSYYIGKTFYSIKSVDRTIEIKGFAERKITSDIVVWSGKIVTRDADLSQAYAKLENDKRHIFSFLEGEDIKQDAVVLTPVSKKEIFQKNEKGAEINKVDFYEVTQQFTITSNDVVKITSLSLKMDQLNMEGIEIQSNPLQYFYSSEKLDKIKVELLGEATKSAKERAEQIVTNSGSSLGNLISARQGIFQVTAENSTEMSDYGVYDTSSINKSVKIVVTLSYATR
jgi:hypothetical protein